MSNLAFRDVTFDVQIHNNQIYVTSVQLAQALGYADDRAITRIYARNSEEFSSGMSEVVKLTPSANLKVERRVFSLRGAHLVAMFSRTPVAKDFRRWVLDILDREASQRTTVPEIDVKTLLLENHYELVAKLPPVLLDAIDKKAWEMAGEAYALFRDYLKRHIAACQYGDASQHIYVNNAMEAINKTTIGNALAHTYYREIDGVERAVSFALYKAEKVLRKIRVAKLGQDVCHE